MSIVRPPDCSSQAHSEKPPRRGFSLAAQQSWFTSNRWLLGPNGSLVKFGCSKTLVLSGSMARLPHMVLFSELAAHWFWYASYEWLLSTAGSLNLPGCFSLMVLSCSMAALRLWCSQRKWLLYSSGSLSHNGCSPYMVRFFRLAAH